MEVLSLQLGHCNISIWQRCVSSIRNTRGNPYLFLEQFSGLCRFFCLTCCFGFVCLKG